MSIRLRRILGPGVQLSADAASGERRPVWIQAAVTGTWLGHPNHPKVEFTEATFDEVIANFRANPAYQADASGVGSKAVVRLDYEHTSEMGLAAPGITTNGLPAPGFIFELKKEPGADGTVQLWALVEMGEQLWGQVTKGEYRWTSVAINPESKDRVTNKLIGHELTSLAITNNPFILGMDDLSESVKAQTGPGIAACFPGRAIYEERSKGQRRGTLIACSLEVWGKPETELEFIVSLRSRFEMPDDAKPSALMLELAKLEQLVDAGALTEDARWLADSLRSMVSLPRLATHKETITAVKAVLTPLVEKEAADQGTQDQPLQVPPVAPAQLETPRMSKPLNARLAPIYKLSADVDDDTLVDKAKGRDGLLTRIVTKLSQRKRSGKAGEALPIALSATEADEATIMLALDAVVKDAEETEEAKETMSVFAELKAALNATGIADVLAKCTALAAEATKYGATVTELNALKAKLNGDEVKGAETEVASIAATHRLDERATKLLLSQVIKTTKDAAGVETKSLRLDDEGKPNLEAVRLAYPVANPDAEKQLLTVPTFAGPAGAQIGSKGTGLPGAGAPVPSGQPVTALSAEVMSKIQACSGCNDVDKTVAYLLANHKGEIEAHPEHQRFYVAGQFLRTGKIIAA